MKKRSAEINGRMWEATYPMCAGCPELVLGSGFFCGYAGNGCRYPNERIKMPINTSAMLAAASDRLGTDLESLAEELGPCTEPPSLDEEQK